MRINVSKDEDYVVGAIIINSDNRIFFQKRSLNRKLFPGCWDIVGGHVEKDEQIIDALKREITEETGWKLDQIIHLIQEITWVTTIDETKKIKREYDFITLVTGDLEKPKLEIGKHDTYYWVSEDEIDMLKENRTEQDDYMYKLAIKVFEYLRSNHDRNFYG